MRSFILLEAVKSIIYPGIKTRSNFFRNSFFSSTITEWNNLDRDIRNSDSLNVFKFSLLKFVRPVANSVFEINNPYGLKLLTKLRLGLSHLRNHKFRHNFQDCINPIFVCGREMETTTPFPPSLPTSFNLVDNPS